MKSILTEPLLDWSIYLVKAGVRSKHLQYVLTLCKERYGRYLVYTGFFKLRPAYGIWNSLYTQQPALQNRKNLVKLGKSEWFYSTLANFQTTFELNIVWEFWKACLQWLVRNKKNVCHCMKLEVSGVSSVWLWQISLCNYRYRQVFI